MSWWELDAPWFWPGWDRRGSEVTQESPLPPSGPRRGRGGQDQEVAANQRARECQPPEASPLLSDGAGEGDCLPLLLGPLFIPAAATVDNPFVLATLGAAAHPRPLWLSVWASS